MSTRDKQGEESRLARWSRLKQAKGVEPETAPVPAAAEPAPAPADDDPDRPLTAEEQATLEGLDLPPVETLDRNSDFAAFLDKRVPEIVRRRALRKLWLSDPAFNFLDRMNDYDEDYSVAAQLLAGATDYRPGQGGYAWKDKPPEETETPEGEDAEADGAMKAEEEEETVAAKSRRLRGQSGDVRAPTYTANPYYQAPGQRDPLPETAQASAIDDDAVGDGEDEPV